MPLLPFVGGNEAMIESYTSGEEFIMAVISVDLDPQLLERARMLTGERSNRAVLDLALRSPGQHCPGRI